MRIRHSSMSQMRPAVMIAALVALSLTATSCLAKVEVGQKAPDFSGLKGVDGKDHALSDYEDAKAVVVVFTCNHCPVSKAYEDRLIQFQKDYDDKDVQLIAINSNSPRKQPKDSYELMVKRAEDKDFNFPYVVDATQEVAKAYGATNTPHFFVLNGDGEVVYVGAMDDNMKADKVETKYVRDAVDAVLAGNEPETASTRPVGCTIKWD